jgi:predicted permease
MRRSRNEIDREVEEEIRFHIDMRTEANIAAGMSASAARRDAELRFGDQHQVLRAGREMLGAALPGRGSGRGGWLDGFLQDIRIGFRMLARNRLATAAAIISLGLGIGANTANFSVAYALLFRQLPFEHADRLLFVDAWNPDRGDGDRPLTWADLEAMRGMEVFENVGAFSERSLTVTAGDHPERISGASITPGLFEIIGVQPAMGRQFRAEEGAAAGFEQVVLISHSLWQRMYAGDPAVVGRTLHLNGREVVVVGVMPQGFRFPELEDLWLPLGTDDPTNHEYRSLIGVARLAPGVGIAAARAQLAVWTERAWREFPRSHLGWDTRAQWFRHGYVDQGTRQAMYLLLAAVGFVLLLACANVANLLLARATDLQRDLVVRSALGATRARLARQVLTESVMLSLVGGALGVAIAAVWVFLMERMIPEEMAFWITIAIDPPILLYTLLISVGTGLAFGILPALQASRVGMEGLSSSGRGVLGDSRGRLRSVLVSAEVALSVVLLASALLMVQSFLEVQVADPGFEEERLLSLRINQAGDQYDDPAARARYYQQVGQRLAALPGAVSAVATGSIPADDGAAPIAIRPDGAAEDEEIFATAILSMNGLFETLGIRPLEGRTITEAEAMDPESDMVVVGASLAERLWPGESAVGRNLDLPDIGTVRVIGVVPDLQYEEFGEDGPSTNLQVHFPFARGAWRTMAILVRTEGEPASLVGPVREELGRLDPTLAPYDIMTMVDRRAFTSWPQRFMGYSFAAFGSIALVLALCGIYGVIAYSVVRRTREIGVRMALGAQPGDVVIRVVGNAMRMAGLGAVLGLVGAVGFAQALQGILYGVSVENPTYYIFVVSLILLAAVLASFLPARRAARIDPTDALRAE